MNIQILYEDRNILVINKPSGIVVHPFDFSSEKTILNFLEDYAPEMFSIKNKVTLQDKRTIHLGGIVHKLDRDTTGIMVLAKHQKTFDELKEQFANHTAIKTYLALVEGKVEKDHFFIEAPLGHSKKKINQRSNPSRPRGELRYAITEVKVIACNKQKNSISTFVELTPKTERAHQLRAHMAHIGHPIVGDAFYGSTFESDRIMIHAKSLTFSVDEHVMTLETNDDFIKKIK